MAQDKPYRFGDVANGHRWTVAGWEPLESPETSRVTQVATAVDDRPTVHYEVGDEADGHRWTGTDWAPLRTGPVAVDDRVHSFGDVVDGHRWTVAGWEPVGGTGADVGASDAQDTVGATMSDLTRPTAGWYPG